jgi:amino acid adenylation domain-containing protein/non-ribosomal peptide synthase protein (TIGR01720 family)
VSNLEQKKQRIAELSPDEQGALFEQLRRKREQEKKTSLSPTAQPISRQSREAHSFPLSFAQQRLWFLEQFEPDTSLYNIPEALRISGRLQRAALRQTLDRLVARHETLRTTFVAIDGEPMQVIGEPQPVNMPLVDLRDLPEPGREIEAMRLVKEEGARPFDLAAGPLLRVTLLQLAEEEYILLLSMHHIISDGWSKGVLMRELTTLYQALIGNPDSAATCLPPLPIQYADFAVWQRQWLQGKTLEEQVSYWKQQLADLPTLQLPTDHPRPTLRTIQGAATMRQLPDGLAQRLVALSRQEKCSLFMVLLAALNVLLTRYTGQEDIPVGTAIANRNRAEIEGLIGFFVNTLVLRANLSGNPTFRELLGQVRRVCLGAYAHQDLPFEQLVEELQPTRDLSGTPLVQVMLTLQNAPKSMSKLPGLTLSPLLADIRTSKFDLTIFVVGNEQRLLLDAEYKRELFEEATINRLLAHLETILAAVVVNPDQPIADIPLLTPAERTQLLVEWNATSVEYPQGDCLHHLFETQVARSEDAIALVYQDEHLTYRELERRANQLAHYLRRLGVGPEVRVGIYVERSPDMAIGLLGILKAGGVCVPLDPEYPKERLRFMLADAQPTVLVTQARFAERLTEWEAPVVVVDAPETAYAAEEETPLAHLGFPQNVAYIIYTSGSTGLPKGVMSTHGALVNRLRWGQETYPLGPKDRVIQKAPFSFDFAIWEFFGPWIAGAQVLMTPPGAQREVRYLVKLITERQVTVTHLIPSLLQVFLEEPGVEQCVSLQHVYGGAEAMSLELQQRFHERLNAAFHNVYGPTEAAIDTTYWTCERTGQDRTVPIGRPLANAQIYVLDERLQPVPIGVAGELYIGGAGLARGYLNRPELTAERFIPHPFSAEPGARLYKTGDMGRWRPDGVLEYAGRNDQQVKIRGYRIELGELEAILRQHPAVREALVVMRDGPQQGSQESETRKRLVAYITQRQQNQATANSEPAEWYDERIAHWQQVFDTTYREPTPEEASTRNFIGWNSSYTNQPIPEEEMREWLEHTVAPILALRPRRVLELGCGTGLLLFQIAPICEQYWGTDLSPEVLDTLRTQVARQGLSQVTLLQRQADDFSGPLSAERGIFDAVILNSVIQYFPSIDYLLRVIEGAAQMLAPGGFIFLGDVRNLPLLEAFHTSVQLRQAPLSLLTEQLRQRVRKRVTQENELLIDPAFFYALQEHLPTISRVDVHLKRGRYHNELTRFRYDTFLHMQRAVRQVAEHAQIDWRQACLTVPALLGLLQGEQPPVLSITNVPNGRVWTDCKAVEVLASETPPRTVEDLWYTLRETDQDAAVDPEELWGLSEKTGYDITISWPHAGPANSYDVLFTRQAWSPADRSEALPVLAQEKEQKRSQHWGAFANNPLQVEYTSNLVPELRDYLKRRLPEYMVPAVIMVLDALPLTPSGKVDRKALPSPDGSRPELKSTFVAPRNANEQILAEIWAQVLGIEQVGVQDNFFELGGDSLMSIRVVAKANKVGLSITTKQLFQHQTIAELAAVAGTSRVLAEQGLVTGPMPLMPGHRFTFGPNMGDPASHSLAYLLQGPEPLDPVLMESVVQEVLAHHDALRLRVTPKEGTWELFIAGLDKIPPLWEVDLSGLSEVEQVAAIRTLMRDLLLGFNLAEEPLLRVALCRLGANLPTPLAVAGHSLVVDMQGWQFLLEDLMTAYQQISQSQKIHLQSKTTSYKQWADRLVEYGQSAQLRAQVPYWLAEKRKRVRPLPVDYPGGANTGASLRRALKLLSEEETQTLQRVVSKIEGLQIDAVLLTAVARSLISWTGERLLLVTVEGHGRSPNFDDIDLSRTLGTMAMEFPLLLDLEQITDPGEMLQTARHELQQLATHGIDYNTLRYMSKDAALIEQLTALPQPDLFFNYLGASMVPEVSTYTVSGPYNGRMYTINAETLQPVPILVTGYIANGQLQATWHYSINQYRPETMERLAQQTIEEVRSLIAYLQTDKTRAAAH